MSFQHLTVAVTCFWCITSPSRSAKCSHSPPPLRPWCFSDSPIRPNNTHHWTLNGCLLIDSWNLLMLLAGSHGYSTINYIYVHIHEWKIHFQPDLRWKHGHTLCHGPLMSWKGPSELQMFRGWLTIPSPFPPRLHEWYLPWEVIISMIWINELACSTSGSILSSSGLWFCSPVSLLMSSTVLSLTLWRKRWKGGIR